MGNYAYYLGDTNGKIFKFDSSYTADGTTAIATQCITRRLDFLDQLPELADRNKTIHGVKLTYVDKGAISVVVSVSSDGGTNWSTNTKTIGTVGADGVVKTKTFNFIETGQFFNVKIYHSATTGSLQWIQLEIELEDAGEHFEI